MSNIQPEQQRKRVSFDPTINLGHLLTFLGFVITGSVAYFDLRERISLGEMRDVHIEQQFKQEQDRSKDIIQEIRAGVREMNRKLDDVYVNRAPEVTRKR